MKLLRRHFLHLVSCPAGCDTHRNKWGRLVKFAGTKPE